MASNCTEHYNLNQWAPEDRVMREDFNADNAAVDAALAGIALHNCKLYMGSYVGQLVQLQGGSLVVTGQYLQLVAMAFSALAMAIFSYFAEKKKMAWLDNFSIAGAMLVGMAAAVICGMIF